MTKPSALEKKLTAFLSNNVSAINTQKIPVIKKTSGSSFLVVSFFTVKGYTILATPKINKALKILLPITLPKTISPLPASIDFIDTANSGALVPKATIVSPIKTLDTLKLFAKEEAPSTKISAPFIKIINPIIIKSTVNIIFLLSKKSSYN